MEHEEAEVSAQGDLVPVSAEEHVQMGLLPGWSFFHAPQDAALACSLCGRPALYVAVPSGLPKCARHARDF